MKLSKALTLMLGIDPIVVMQDIAGTSREEGLEALEWSARALTEATMRDIPERPVSPNGQKLSSRSKRLP
jgi:hypothetical protein